MNNTDNSASVQANFKSYLVSQNKGMGTVKNYTGDVAEYLRWAPIPEDSKLYLSRDLALQYRAYLQSKGLKDESIRRAFAALNSFARFCISQGWLHDNPIQDLTSESKDAFAVYLENQGLSSQSARQYATDIKDANEWLNELLQVSTQNHVYHA